MRLAKPQKAIANALARYPVYRIVPARKLREHAAVRYHSRAPWEQFARYIRSTGIPTDRLSSAHRAARVAFRAGDDDLLAPALTIIERRYPDAAEIHELRSDLHEFRGEYEQALTSALKARLLQPSATSAVARVMRLNYRVLDQESADVAAIQAVRRFPLSRPVLSAVCRAAETPAQFDRIFGTWREHSSSPEALTKVVRQLANGALRTGRVDVALDLYSEAITLVATGKASAPPVTKPSLATRSAWTAIQDLCNAFDNAGIPFFFAAGTALGLVREGRPLASDDDIDVGVFDVDWNRERITEVFTNDARFSVSSHPSAPKIGLAHRAGSRIDIFRFHEEDGEVWHDGVFVRWHNTPFAITRKEINGRAVPLPDDSDRYLTENYGDWRTPNSSFDAFTDDAPNVEVTWPEQLQAHFLRRAYQRLLAGDRTGARRDLVHAGREELTELVSAGD